MKRSVLKKIKNVALHATRVKKERKKEHLSVAVLVSGGVKRCTKKGRSSDIIVALISPSFRLGAEIITPVAVVYFRQASPSM